VDWSRTPLVECFECGDVPRDVRLMAASGGLALRVPEQLALLMVLVSDPDPEVVATAEATITRLPPDSLAAFLANADVPEHVRTFFSVRQAGMSETTSAGRLAMEAPEDAESAQPGESDGTRSQTRDTVERQGAAQRLANLPVSDRIRAAIQGTREERTILVRDPNRLVTAAVLSSPKLTEGDVEVIARMTNVSDEVLRVIGTNRAWTKSYAVVAALARNAKTPVGVALTLLPRLTERDVKILSTDRNVPEPVRLSARKLYTRNVSRRQ
jgi:hypothetical protein